MNWPFLLAKHDMFRNLLLGNPTSITMMASAHQNPMIPCTLVQMYDSLKQDSKQKLKVVSYDNNGKPEPIVVENIMSIEVFTEMSVKLLEDLGHGDVNLLYFLGCLPDGITMHQLDTIWRTQDSESAKESMKRLKQLSLLEHGVERKVLTQTMYTFIQSKLELDLDSMKGYMLSICQFYNKLLAELYE